MTLLNCVVALKTANKAVDPLFHPFSAFQLHDRDAYNIFIYIIFTLISAKSLLIGIYSYFYLAHITKTMAHDHDYYIVFTFIINQIIKFEKRQSNGTNDNVQRNTSIAECIWSVFSHSITETATVNKICCYT